MIDEFNIRELYNDIIRERAAANGVTILENVTIPVTRTSPDRLEFDGNTLNFDANTRPFAFIGDNSDLIGTINNSDGTHPYIFSAFRKAAAAVGLVPFPATMSYMSAMYQGTKPKDIPNILKKDGVSFLGKLSLENMKYFSEHQVEGMMSATRRNTRAGRIWFDVSSKKAGGKVNVIVFWCREKDLKNEDLKKLNEYFKLGEFFWSATDSKNFNFYGENYRDTPTGEIKELRSKIYPNLSHDDIVDILMRAHTGFNMSPFERKVVWEFRGFDPSEIKHVTGGYPTVAEYEYRKKLSENHEK